MRVLKLLILLIAILLIYFFMPLNSAKLIYLPKKDESLYLLNKYQDSLLNIIDYNILRVLNVKSGWIRVQNLKTRYDIYKAAINNKREKTRFMVMYLGDSLECFAKKIAKQANLDKDTILKEYRKKANFKEGSIFAKRYKIPYDTNECATISYMLYKSDIIFSKFAKEHNLKYSSNKFEKILIIASIIAKETNFPKEYSLISSVIYNRLKKDLKLQMDATLNYGKNCNTIITPNLIKQDNSKFNTYKFKGLPPQAIGSVNLKVLNAAINPANSNYIYFVKSKKGHMFSDKFKEHKKNVKVYKTALKKLKKLKKQILNSVVVKLPTNPVPKFDFMLKKLNY